MATETGTILEPEVIAPVVTRQEENTALARRYAERSEVALAEAKSFAVLDLVTYDQAGEKALHAAENRKRCDEILGTVTDGIYKEWKRLRSLFAPPVETWKKVAELYGQKRLSWKTDQERIAEEARRKAEEQARKEQERLDRLAMERAARAEAKGDHKKAEEILETRPVVAVPVGPIGSVVEPTKGLATKTYWHARVKDRVAFLTALSTGEIPLDSIPDTAWAAIEGKLSRMAGSLQAQMEKTHPGVEVWSDKKEQSTGR